MAGGEFRRWCLGLAAGSALAAVIAPGVAQASPRDFRIPAKPLSEALIDFAVQADLSIDTRAARTCRRLGNAVSGRMEAQEALRRLLDGTGCGFERVGPRALRVVRLAPRPSAPPRPAPPPELPAVPVTVDDLIVTATRRPSVATRLPYAVSTVPGEVLVQQGVADAAEVALLTPSLTVTNLGTGRDKLIVRGLSDGGLTGQIQSTVGIYLDDVRLTYSAPDPELRLVDIRRVEVLRGPQGSLYGSGSIGGVFHMVTRKPQYSDWEAAASAELSFTSEGGFNYVAEGMANMPLFGDRAALRVVVYRDRQSGYIDNPLLGQEDVNATVRGGGRATLRVDLHPRWELTAGLVGQTISSSDSQYVQGGLPDLTRATRVAEPHHNDFSAGFLTLSGDMELARLRWTTAYVNHRFRTRYDASDALPAFGAPAGPAARWDERLSGATWQSEFNLMSPIGARFPWLMGAFVADGDQDLATRLRGAGDVYGETRTDHLSEVSLYGEASAPFGAWTLTVGGRYFWSGVETRSDIVQPGQGAAAFSGDLEESGFAPKVVVRYQFDDRLMVYAQAAEGYRTGGFNTGGPIGQVFGAPGAGIQPLRRYRGDELWSYEAGAKWFNPDLGLTLQGAAFHVAWDNIQSTQPLPSGAPYTANLGSGRALGLEVEAAWSVGDFDLGANLLVNEPELDEPRASFPGADDSLLAGVARFAASVYGHYERPIGGALALTADARAAFVGPSRLTFDAATAPEMGDYWATRLAVGLKAPDWRAGLYLDNAMDDRGDTFAFGNPFTVRGQRHDTPQRPLTLGISLDWNF